MARSKRTSARGAKTAGSRKSSAAKKAARKTSSKTTKAKASAPAKPKAAKPKVTAPAKPKATARRSPGTRAESSAKPRLDKKHVNEFRKTLLEKRRTLLGDLNGMEEHATNQKGSGNLSSMPTHMADLGTDNFEHEFTLGLLESEQSLLREIDEAIQRIEEGTYGVCLGTGRRIPLARLRAKPWAKYTVEYARKIEQGLVRQPGENRSAPEE